GGPWDKTDKYIRQGNDIEHSDSAADRSLAIFERIPGEANSGSEILERRVVVVGIAGTHLRIGDVSQVSDLPIHLFDYGVHVISHTEIQCQVGADTEIVLKISSENRVSLAADAVRSR